MKIAVVLPSRGHPQRLSAILTALDHLSSGKLEINYHVFADADDSDTISAIRNLETWWPGGSISLETGSNETSHFNRINAAYPKFDADVLTWFTDDVFPLALRWDLTVARALEQGYVAFAWTELVDPNNVTYPILSRQWLEVLGYVFPPYFPYWFVDTWIMEVYELAFARDYPIIRDLPVGGRRGRTGQMHDLTFWFEFFQATQRERAQHARKVASAFSTGVTPGQISTVSARHQKRIAAQMERIPHFTQRFSADSTPKTDRYLRLKSQAEKWLHEHRNDSAGPEDCRERETGEAGNTA